MKDREPGSRPVDPYRREPPVIDLPKAEFTSDTTAELVSYDERSPEAQTAIEPMASMALDGAPGAPAVDAAEAPSVTPTPDEEIPGDEAAPAVAPFPSDTRPSSSGIGGSVPPISARQAAPEKRGTSGFVAASLAGGVIGAAFAVGADVYWRQPPADYESRLAALETRPRQAAPVPTIPQPGSDALERRIVALETQASGLSEGVTAARSAAEASQKQIAELATGTARPAPSAPADAPQPDPALRQGLDRLGTRLDALEGRIAQAAPAAAIDELRAAIQNAQNQAEKRQRAVTASLGATQAATAGLDQRLQTNTAEVTKLSAEVGKLPPTLLQAGLRAVVAGQIGQYLRAGLPLGPGLSALERSAPRARLWTHSGPTQRKPPRAPRRSGPSSSR